MAKATQHWDIAYRAWGDMHAELIAANLDERKRALAVEAMRNLCTGYLRAYEEKQDAAAARWAAVEAAAEQV